jgi:hypothetical protein
MACQMARESCCWRALFEYADARSMLIGSSLPWLAGQIETPGVTRIPLPDNGRQTQAMPQSASLAESAHH